MSGDWIRMRSGLLKNPRVIRMGKLLAKDRRFISWWTHGCDVTCDVTVREICDAHIVTRVTVGSLLAFWGSLNECATGEGFVSGIDVDDVDELAGVPGFGDALASVGWLTVTDGGIIFSNFDQHNTVGSVRRSGAPKSGADRQREYRERKRAAQISADPEAGPPPSGDIAPVTSDVTDDVTALRNGDGREEKSRGELEDITPGSKTHTGDGQAARVPSPAAVLTIALRQRGVQCSPPQQQIVELVEQGVSVETVIAAVEQARSAKPHDVIKLSYVIGILTNWAKEAGRMNVAGAQAPVANNLAAIDGRNKDAIAEAIELRRSRQGLGPTIEMEPPNA